LSIGRRKVIEKIMPEVKHHKFYMRKQALAVLAACTSLASVAQNEQLELPDMGASADTIISRAEEEEYAKALVRQMRAFEVLNEDPLISAYFEDMGFRLASHSNQPDKPLTFVVVNQDVVNAFAAPGGVIALFSGLILEADDENEVAGVLAHEIAHITQKHLYRAMENQQAMTIPLTLAMLGLILVGGGSGEAIQGALMGTQAAALQAQINFTRQNEAEADRIGIGTLAAAGYNPIGMAEFFEKMGRISRAMGKGPPEFLRTHPVSVSRITEAKDRAENMPEPELSDGRDFYLVQARLRAMIEEYPDTALEFFDDRLDRADTSQAESDSLFYGRAIALQRKGEYKEARKLLEGLMAGGQHLAFELQLAELDLDSGNEQEALDRLDALYHSFPGNHAISLQYGRALLHSQDPERAETASVILRQQLLTHPEDPTLYELYARASNTADDLVRSSEAIAESYYLRGNIHDAVLQLQKLADRDNLDYYERARITDRLKELRTELSEMNLKR
jgi:predicted Zn-dependent protease